MAMPPQEAIDKARVEQNLKAAEFYGEAVRINNALAARFDRLENMIEDLGMRLCTTPEYEMKRRLGISPYSDPHPTAEHGPDCLCVHCVTDKTVSQQRHAQGRK